MVFDTARNKWITGQIAKLAPTLLFRPWPYLAVSIVVLVLAWRQRHAYLNHIVLLGSSSFLYTLPYAVIGVSAEFRYLWWPVVATILQLVIFISALPWKFHEAPADRPLHIDFEDSEAANQAMKKIAAPGNSS
jgi:hypothetical protein